MSRVFLCQWKYPYKTIFHVSLLYQLDELCVQGDQNNEYEESSPVSLRNSPFKTIFWVQWSYRVIEALSPGDLNEKCAWFLCILLIVFLFIPLLTLQHSYQYHIANMSHTTIMLNGHIDPTYLPISTTIQPTTKATSHIFAKICARNKYAQHVPQMLISFYANMRQLCQYIYLTWAHCN